MVAKLAELDTPAIVVDLDVMEDNIARMAAYRKAHSLKLRPHIKTHKTPEIARLQMEAGACGIACQKVGEAEVMMDAGLSDILVCYNIIGRQKLERLVRVACGATLSVALDSIEVSDAISWAARAAGKPIGVLIELDVGAGSCWRAISRGGFGSCQTCARPEKRRVLGDFDLPREIERESAARGNCCFV